MKSYDKVFITNLPSFYKKNLYNEINKKQRVLAIFTDDGDPTRNGDFYNGNIEFDSENLGKRNSFSKVFFLLKIIFFANTKCSSLEDGIAHCSGFAHLPLRDGKTLSRWNLAYLNPL